MSAHGVPTVSFLQEVMRLRKHLPSQLAAHLGVSHTTVGRWLSGKFTPNIKSCRRLAEYSGTPLQQILSITGYLPEIANGGPANWPAFRDYAHGKYPDELDEDEIIMIEDLIERRRARKRGKKGS